MISFPFFFTMKHDQHLYDNKYDDRRQKKYILVDIIFRLYTFKVKTFHYDYLKCFILKLLFQNVIYLHVIVAEYLDNIFAKYNYL